MKFLAQLNTTAGVAAGSPINAAGHGSTGAIGVKPVPCSRKQQISSHLGIELSSLHS